MTQNTLIEMDTKEMRVMQKVGEKALHDLQSQGVNTNREETVILCAQSFLKAAIDEIAEKAKKGESVELNLFGLIGLGVECESMENDENDGNITPYAVPLKGFKLAVKDDVSAADDYIDDDVE